MRISDWSSDVCSSELEAARSQGGGADLACAVTNGRTHPVFGLWPVALRDALRRAMVEEEIRKVDLWTARYTLVEVAFPGVETPAGPLDPFFNTNRPEDLDEAERYLYTPPVWRLTDRSEEPTSELQSLMRISYAVLCLKKKI